MNDTPKSQPTKAHPMTEREFSQVLQMLMDTRSMHQMEYRVAQEIGWAEAGLSNEAQKAAMVNIQKAFKHNHLDVMHLVIAQHLIVALRVEQHAIINYLLKRGQFSFPQIAELNLPVVPPMFEVDTPR